MDLILQIHPVLGGKVLKLTFWLLLVSLGFPKVVSEKEITLILYFDDGLRSQLAAGPVMTLDKVLGGLEDLGVENLRALYIPKKIDGGFTSLWFEKALERNNISDQDKIRNLVLASHGATDLDLNETIIDRLGRFGPNGVLGDLKWVLEILKSRFTEFPHIFLASCTTFCGSRDKIEQRVLGLYSALKTRKTKGLSIWGSYNLVRGSPFSEEDREKSRNFDRWVGRIMVGPLYPIYLLGLSYIIHYVANLGNSPTLSQLFLTAGVVALVRSYSTVSLYKELKKSGFGGYLV